MFYASADLLQYLDLHDYAEIVRDATDKAINVERLHTPDLGGTCSTTDVVDFVIGEVKSATQLKAYQAQQ